MDGYELYKGLQLAHHGVKEQKWGVQNGPPYPLSTEQKIAAGYIKDAKRPKFATKSKKKIDKLESKNEKLRDKLSKAKRKGMKANAKAAKALGKKGISDPKASKLLKKSLLAQNKASILEAKINKNQAKINDLVDYLKENGFEIVNNELLDKNIGEVVLDAKMQSEGWFLPFYANSDNPMPGLVQRDEMLQRARDNDEYDIDFLEAVQNDPVIRKGGKALLKEYKSYLKDPQTYERKVREEGSAYAKSVQNNPRIKAILDKAEEIGYNSLSDAEKEIVNKYAF